MPASRGGTGRATERETVCVLGDEDRDLRPRTWCSSSFHPKNPLPTFESLSPPFIPRPKILIPFLSQVFAKAPSFLVLIGCQDPESQVRLTSGPHLSV